MPIFPNGLPEALVVHSLLNRRPQQSRILAEIRNGVFDELRNDPVTVMVTIQREKSFASLRDHGRNQFPEKAILIFEPLIEYADGTFRACCDIGD